MGRPSIVRFGGRRFRSAAAGKRARATPSVLSFRAVNQVLQDVLQVSCSAAAVAYPDDAQLSTLFRMGFLPWLQAHEVDVSPAMRMLYTNHTTS